MDWSKVVLAGGAGTLSIVVFLGCGWLALWLVADQILPFANQNVALPISIVCIVGLMALAAMSLSLPALALGAGWQRSLYSAVAAILPLLAFVILLVFPIPHKLFVLLFVVAVIPAFIVTVAISKETQSSAALSPLPYVWAIVCVFLLVVAALNFAYPALDYSWTGNASLLILSLLWPVLPATAAYLLFR